MKHWILAFTCLAISLLQLRAAEAEPKHRLIFPFQSKHVHSSSIVQCPNGDLLAVWFHGTGERTANDVQIQGSRLRHGQDTWDPPFIAADTPNVPDLTNPTKRQMIVVGSQLKDTISVAVASGKLSVTINGLKRSYAVANIVGIVVRGNDGDDTITLANTVTIGGILDGGFGDDILTGSVGNDLLLGGEGDDKLLGVGGKDVLIGGDGHDSLAGGLADDLLIGGATVYDNSPAALLAILSEWTSLTNNYATRTQNLRQGLTVAPRLSATEIFDGFYDELTADTGATGGLELLFYDEFDLLTGVSAATEQAVLVQ